jgi:glycosyltransferase AglI
MSYADDVGTDRLMLSVVIPVYNDPKGIRMTLETLVEQTYPAEEYEILAVDNGSTDGTPEVIRAFTGFYDHVHLLVEDEIQGSYAARNEGIRHARGEVISFIDADVTVEETWAESVVDSFEKHGWDYTGCRIETYIEGDETLGAIYDHLLGGFPVEDYIERRNFAVTACLSVDRGVFDTVGTFDDRIRSHGDEEFGKRVHEAGFEQHFESAITAYHPTRSTLYAWLEKQFRIGRGAMEIREHHSEKAERSSPFTLRRFLPTRPRGFYARLTDATDPTPRMVVVLYLVDYLSKLARTAGSSYERAKQYWTHKSRYADV